jgi:hypothetical protein
MTKLDSRPGPVWPGLPLASWAATGSTLHMWTQIVGIDQDHGLGRL